MFTTPLITFCTTNVSAFFIRWRQRALTKKIRSFLSIFIPAFNFLTRSGPLTALLVCLVMISYMPHNLINAITNIVLSAGAGLHVPWTPDWLPIMDIEPATLQRLGTTGLRVCWAIVIHPSVDIRRVEIVDKWHGGIAMHTCSSLAMKSHTGRNGRPSRIPQNSRNSASLL